MTDTIKPSKYNEIALVIALYILRERDCNHKFSCQQCPITQAGRRCNPRAIVNLQWLRKYIKDCPPEILLEVVL